MKIIEFFGLPFSGKSHLSNKYLKKNKYISSELFFYYYLYKKKKIPLWLYEYFIFLKKINSSIFISKICRSFLKIYFTIFLDLNLEKKIIYQKMKIDYSKINNLMNLMIKGNTKERKIQLRKWIKDELINIYIAKKLFSEDKKILILSEGLVQRIHSFYLFKKKFDKQLVKKYLSIIPMSDIILFIDTNINTIKYRIAAEEKNKKNIFYSENIKLLKERINYIYKCVVKKKKIIHLKK